MTAIVNPALGRSSTGFTIAAVSVDSSGTLTASTARTITGQLTEWEPDFNNETENISAVTTRNANEVIVETMNSLKIGGFLFASDSVATPTNYPWSISQTSDYIKCVGTWAGRTFTFWGVIKHYTEGIRSKGKIEFSLEVGFPDIGSANPLFT